MSINCICISPLGMLVGSFRFFMFTRGSCRFVWPTSRAHTRHICGTGIKLEIQNLYEACLSSYEKRISSVVLDRPTHVKPREYQEREKGFSTSPAAAPFIQNQLRYQCSRLFTALQVIKSQNGPM